MTRPTGWLLPVETNKAVSRDMARAVLAAALCAETLELLPGVPEPRVRSAVVENWLLLYQVQRLLGCYCLVMGRVYYLAG